MIKKIKAYLGIVSILSADVAQAFIPLQAQICPTPEASLVVYRRDSQTTDVELTDRDGNIVGAHSVLSAAAVLTSEEEIADDFNLETVISFDGFGRVRLDKNNALILDAESFTDKDKIVEFITDRNVIISSVQCAGLLIAAPSVTVSGNSDIGLLNVSVSDEKGAFMVSEGVKLSAKIATVDGRIFNCGTMSFLSDDTEARLISEGSDFFNCGTVEGNRFVLCNLGSLFNFGTISGKYIGVQSNLLNNKGVIGSEESMLDFLIHKSILNGEKIAGQFGKIVLTDDEQIFQNNGLLAIKEADFQIPGVLENFGCGVFDNLTGSVSTFLNKGEFKAQSGIFSVNSGENRHILRLGTLISAGDFFNCFTDPGSFIQLGKLSGTGTFFNKSAFLINADNGIEINEFRNQNADFVEKFGMVSFGGNVNFLQGCEKFTNEGVLISEKLNFESDNISVTNETTAVIQISRQITGRVGNFDNLGSVLSTNSFIFLSFDAFTNRNSFAASEGVRLQGRRLVNMSRLSLCNSRADVLINGVGANLWLYFSSLMKETKNSGHLQYIKGIHTTDVYFGEDNSEFTVPYLRDVTLPQCRTGCDGIFATSRCNVGNRAIAEKETRVIWKRTAGKGKIGAQKIITGDLEEFKDFFLFGAIEAYISKIPSSLPMFSGELSLIAKFKGFANEKDIVLPAARLVFDLAGGDFDNTGSIACREFLLGNCGIFKNQRKIDAYGDIDVTARQILNECLPVKESRETVPNTTHPNRTREKVMVCSYDFYKPGDGYLRSHTGSVKLNGVELIENKYSYLSAAKSFYLTSKGKIVNYVGHIYAFGSDPSYIRSLSFAESCAAAAFLIDGKYSYYESGGGFFNRRSESGSGPIRSPYNTSEKSKIYSAGDLHLEVKQAPLITGSDVLSGGSIICNIPRANFRVENVHTLVPRIAAGQAVIVNGRDIGIKGALFLAGYGITLTASGQISVINPADGQVLVPPRGAVDVSIRKMAKKMYGPLLVPSPLSFSDLESAHRMIFDPTHGMKRLFFGCAPNPLKKLVFNTPLMSLIPVVLSDVLNIFGTQVLNSRSFLALMDENAQHLPETLVPSDMPNKPLLYFKIKSVDDETEEADPYLHITTEMMRDALASNTGIICEQGPVIMEAGNGIIFDRALVSGTNVELTAIKDKTLKDAQGRITATASRIKAKDTLRLKAEEGIHINAGFDVNERRTFGHDEFTRIQTAEINPSVLSAKQIVLEGGGSAVRGTIVEAEEFLDSTEHLIFGVDKQRLEYESYKKKEGLFGSSDIHHTGWHEIIAPTVLKVGTLLSVGGQSLEFESVLAEGLQRLLVQKPVYRETAAVARSRDEVRTSSSGISFGKTHISDPLVGAWRSLIGSHNAKALAGSAISAATSILGSSEEAKTLFNAFAAGINADAASLVAGTLIKRLVNVNFSVGSSETTVTTRKTEQIPNKISAELIRLECPTMVRLQGIHSADEFYVDTESFEATDVIASESVDSRTESTGFDFNVVSAIVGTLSAPVTGGGGAAAVCGAGSFHTSDVSRHTRRTTRTPTTVRADKFILRAGKAHLTDVQIRARLTDAIIRDDAILESVCDEFFDESEGGSFSAGFG
ncbi:MAG: hypothetical protein LBO73_00420, partial [Holosporaceae bacterium]|nr:hypothetical protein [Holosporaceae bacterium]